MLSPEHLASAGREALDRGIGEPPWDAPDGSPRPGGGSSRRSSAATRMDDDADRHDVANAADRGRKARRRHRRRQLSTTPIPIRLFAFLSGWEWGAECPGERASRGRLCEGQKRGILQYVASAQRWPARLNQPWSGESNGATTGSGTTSRLGSEVASTFVRSSRSTCRKPKVASRSPPPSTTTPSIPSIVTPSAGSSSRPTGTTGQPPRSSASTAGATRPHRADSDEADAAVRAVAGARPRGTCAEGSRAPCTGRLYCRHRRTCRCCRSSPSPI